MTAPFLPPIDMSWLADVFLKAIAALLSALADGLSQFLGQMFAADSPFNFVSRTPPDLSYQSDSVRNLWEATRTIANAALAAVVAWGGFNAMVRPYFGSTYHDVMELVPRVLLGAVLANTSLDWCRLAIDFNNAFCAAVGEVTPPGFDQTPSAGQALINLVSLLIYLVMGLLLALQMLMRLALVDVLLVVAPLALLCWVLPQTQGWARLWSALFTGTVFVQSLQMLALRLGVSLASELKDLTPGTAGQGAAEIVRTFLGIAVLALVLKLPRYMPGPSSGAGGVATVLEGLAMARGFGISGGGGRGSGGKAPSGKGGGKASSGNGGRA